MSKQTNTKPEELLLYAVTDRHWLNGATLISQVEAALKGGATFIQLREKNLDDEAFYKEALEIQKLCRNYKVPFVINDNVELAKKIGADGVHVGQSERCWETIRSSVYLHRQWNRQNWLKSMERIIWALVRYFQPDPRMMQQKSVLRR